MQARSWARAGTRTESDVTGARYDLLELGLFRTPRWTPTV
jgi:hypothetical protein